MLLVDTGNAEERALQPVDSIRMPTAIWDKPRHSSARIKDKESRDPRNCKLVETGEIEGRVRVEAREIANRYDGRWVPFFRFQNCFTSEAAKVRWLIVASALIVVVVVLAALLKFNNR